MRIGIVIGALSMEATLHDTPTARKLYEILPYRSPFKTWGDEIYFEIPVDEDLDDSARDEVSVGEIGYWPTGNALCIFCGPTPVSRDGRILPGIAVNILGRVEGDVGRFRAVMNNREVVLEALPDRAGS